MNEWPPSTKPFRASPPEGTVGIVLPIKDDLRFFKLAYHSILAFTDYRYMLTIVDNMSGIQTRQYLESIRKNHNINVLQYQKEHNLSAEWNLGLRFMFAYATVKYAVCVTPTIVVQPYWLSGIVKTLESSEKPDLVIPESNTNHNGLVAFRREAYERINGFDEKYDPISDVVERSMNVIRSRTYVHKFKVNGFDPRTEPVQEKQEAAI